MATQTADQRELFNLLLKKKGFVRRSLPVPRRTTFSPCEASFAQQRLWFIEQLNPGSPAYNMPGAFTLTGALDVNLLARVFTEIVRRHEALRTTFLSVNGRPMQEIHAAERIAVPLADLTALPVAFREPESARVAAAESVCPFDISAGPLLRASALRIERETHVVLFTMHHIVSDGWSLGVLAREFSALYATLSASSDANLPELPIQYADYAVWQRESLSGQALVDVLNYWKSELAGIVPLVLPTDRPRPAIPSGRGGVIGFEIDQRTARLMRDLASSEETTLFVVALTAFQVFLHRYAGQNDIVVGCPVANRGRVEVEPLIGFFVNQIIIRARMAGDPTFRGLLQQQRETAIQAFARQELPFERLVEELEPERNTAQNPLVQVSFAYQNTQRSNLGLRGLRAQPFAVEPASTRFDLELHMWEGKDRMGGMLLYSTDLFEPGSAERIVRYFVATLDGAVQQPDRRLSGLSPLSESDRRTVLEEFNATEAEFPADRGVHELFEEQVSLTPHAIAIQSRSESVDYDELNRRSNRLAHYLRATGVKPDTRVAVCMARSVDMFVALLGVMKAGGAWVPIDPGNPARRTDFILSDSGAFIILADRAGAASLNGIRARILRIDEEQESIAAERSLNILSCTDPANIAYVIYTSGSTGRPKGVMVTHRGLANYLTWSKAAYRTSEGSGTVVHSSFAFDLAVTSILAPLCAGRRVRLADEEPGVDGLVRALAEERDLSFLKLTPGHLRALRDRAALDDVNSRARLLILGGEALRQEDVEFLRDTAPDVHIVNEYGPTETVVGSCVYELPPGALRAGAIPIGRPIANTRLYVLDSYLDVAPFGALGELFIGGVGVARGYLGRPDLTADRFVPDPFSPEPGARMYRTGDIVRFLQSGDLDFHGRADEETKIRGYRVDPREVESQICRHPAVREAAVVAHQDAGSGKLLAAFATVRPDYRFPPAWTEELHRERVEQWRMVFEDSFGQSTSATDAAENFAGWTSSYTSQPLPLDEMREWLTNTATRILAHRPRRILEIGCGTGLLLFRIAPQCECYWATDFSSSALASVKRVARERGLDLSGVRLFEQAADDPLDFAGNDFDAVILNSVIQYFPDVDYLQRVLDRAAGAVRPGGCIFVGDVRSLPLLDAFHLSVAVHQSPNSRKVGDLKRELLRRTTNEEELLLHPDFFYNFACEDSRIGAVSVELKRGQSLNELTRYRYDVTMHVGAAFANPEHIEHRDWIQDRLTIAGARHVMDAMRPECLVIANIPNARTEDDLETVRYVQTPQGRETAGDLKRDANSARSTGVDPEQLWSLAARWPEYNLRLICSGAEPARLFTAVFNRMPADWVPSSNVCETAPSAWANNPLWPKLTRRLAPEIRTQLQDELPTWMVPSSISIVPELPMAASGKIDQKALAEFSAVPSASEDFHASPRSAVEEIVSGIWSGVLDVERVDGKDNFFNIGGHSLLGTQVVSRIRTVFCVELPLRALFEAPTLAAFAKRVESALRANRRGAPPAITASVRLGAIPLSFAQQRLWFLDQLFPANRAYHIPLSVGITGPLHFLALEQSLQNVINRHEILRTRFPATDGQPVQVIDAPGTFSLPLIDLTALDHWSAESEATRITAEDAARPFDLGSDRLLRAALVRIDSYNHVAVLTMHHIITDGWSMGIVVRELATSYDASRRGERWLPAPLPVQYADFAIWQRAWLSEDVLERQLSYWRTQLSGGLPELNLPVDRVRPAIASHRGHARQIVLSQDLHAALLALSRREGATLFMASLAAFLIVLLHETGQDDLVIGTDIANRNHEATEELIGFFVNQLVLRVRLARCRTYSEVLAHVRHTTMDAYDNQDVPFERLVQELQLERDLGRAPLFQVNFSLGNMPRSSMRLPGTTWKALPVGLETSKFDWLVALTETPNGLLVVFEYDTDLFEQSTIDRVLRNYEIVMKSIIDTPECSLDQLRSTMAANDDRHGASARSTFRQSLRSKLRELRSAPVASVR